MKIATLDLETDPFEYGRVPAPFAAGFYDGERFIHIWHQDCVARMVDAIAKLKEPYLIYAHNGGKFDFFYFLPHCAGDLKIINGRVVQAHLGKSELRDSFAIMPFPLAAYRKTKIDYDKLKVDQRDLHRQEIIDYLRDDCVALHELVTAYHAEFGDCLTIGSSALKQIRQRHTVKFGGPAFDSQFRSRFYYGGRVQCFGAGIIRRPLRIYDVNSMYPHVMATMLHPVGTAVHVDKTIHKHTCFLMVEGKNYGAFPLRTKYGLDFTVPEGTFFPSIYEWQVSQDTGTFKCSKIRLTFSFDARVTFDEFVHYFYNSRAKARLRNDRIHDLFYKFVLNSGYGKFAQNPENFQDYQLTPAATILPAPWSPKEEWSSQGYTIWSKPPDHMTYYNVCTGASITGAARSVLLRGLADATGAVYCDTDSIMCESLRTLPVSPDTLGSWKLEATGNVAAIAGKKTYALYQDDVCIKKAHKGVVLSPADIWRVASGETVQVHNPVPAFKFDGRHQFISRKVQRTV